MEALEARPAPQPRARKTWGRTRRIQTREGGSVREVGERHALEGGAATGAVPEYPQPKWDWGEEESLEVTDLASPPQHPLATRGRDHRGPIDQSGPSVSWSLSWPSRPRRPDTPGSLEVSCPSYAQRLSQTPGNPLPGGVEDYWENVTLGI